MWVKGRARISEPPNDGREWVCVSEAAKMLSCCRERAVWRAKKFEWTRYVPADKSQSWILKKDILDWLKFVKMRADWYRRHRPQHWERQNSTLDVQTAQRSLLTCHEAAEILGISSDRLVKLANQGKIHVFLTPRIWRGSRYWFALETIKEYQQDSKRRRRQEIYQKGLETRRKRQLGIAPQEPPATSSQTSSAAGGVAYGVAGDGIAECLQSECQFLAAARLFAGEATAQQKGRTYFVDL